MGEMINGVAINLNESYRNKTDIDEWGCACCWLDEDETVGAEYNYCFENGKSYCAFYGFTQFSEVDYTYYTDFDAYRHYDIEWDKPDWKERLSKNLLEFAKEWKEKERQNFIEWERRFYK